MFRRILLSIFTLVFLVSCMTGSGRLETQRSLSDSPHGYQLVASPVRAGEVSQRFEVRPGDCAGEDCVTNRERSEVTLRQVINPGTSRWIAYSLYLPSDFYSSPNVNTTIGQIHQRGGPTGTAGGFPSFPPLLQISARSNRVDACVHILTGPDNDVRDVCQDFSLSTVSAMRGRWTDFVIHLDARGEGFMEIYMNGQRKVQTSGFIRFVPENYYVNYGIYRSFVSRHGGPMPTQIAYYDEVRIGADRASVAVSAENPVD